VADPRRGPVPAMTSPTYRSAVVDFKRQLIETTLREHGGNRTHAARALGVQRTYLLRLIRDLRVATPASAGRHGERPAT